MQVKDLPEIAERSRTLVSIGAESTVTQAAKLMADKRIGALLVLENGAVKGIFTERDILSKIVSRGVNPDETKVQDVMTANVVTARLDEPLSDCLDKMSSGKFRHLPIVDEDGTAMAMLSQRDFIAVTFGDAVKRARVAGMARLARGYQPALITGSVLIYTVVLILTLTGGQ